MVVWDLYILTAPGISAISGRMPRTLKDFVLANWVWLHHRPLRVPCYLKQVMALHAADKITAKESREATMLLGPPLVLKEAWGRVELDCVWTEEALEQNRKNWTALLSYEEER